jgi:RimJ/RimL family protein N-acetyltransferase
MNDRRVRDVPLAFETERLLLRCPRPADAAIVHASVVETLPMLRRFPASFPWAMGEPSIATTERYCIDAQERYLARTEFALLAFAKADAAHVGNLALHDIDWSVPKCEIGYWGRSSLTGRGLMTEAVIALTKVALDGLGMRRVDALPEPDNHESRRLCERAGYALEGTLRNFRVAPDGTVKDACVYSIVR